MIVVTTIRLITDEVPSIMRTGAFRGEEVQQGFTGLHFGSMQF